MRRPGTGLPRQVHEELEQTAHGGRADVVKGLVLRASRAYERGDYAEALGPALRAKTIAPRSWTVRELLGLVSYRMGRFRDAARELSAYRRLSGRRDLDHLLADCERALGRPEKAIETVDAIPPGELDEEQYVEALVVAAGALTDLGRHDEAAAMLRRGPVRSDIVLPYHLRLWYALADALERAGGRSEARQLWDLVYAEDPEFFDVAERRLRRT